MERVTFQDSEVNTAISEGYVFEMFDVSKDIELAKLLSVNGIPDSIIIESTGEVVKRKFGFSDVEEFLSWLN